MFYAVTLGHTACTDALVAAGALLNRQDMKGRTAAHCAAAKGNLVSIKALHYHGADLWVKNARGDFPIHESVHAGEKETICWLLSGRPEAVNSANNDGRTLLHLAALYDRIEICQVLMDQGAFVNAIMRNARGQLLTPFDAAMHRSNKGCAKYLQLHGGVPAAKITDKSALQKALVRAFSEGQGEKTRPKKAVPLETAAVITASIMTSTEKCEKSSVGNQTADVATKHSECQSIIDTSEFSSQTEALVSQHKEAQTVLQETTSKQTQELLETIEAIEADSNNRDSDSEDNEVTEGGEGDAAGLTPSRGEHIVLEEEAKQRLHKARQERLKFFQQETINGSQEENKHSSDCPSSPEKDSPEVSPVKSKSRLDKDDSNKETSNMVCNLDSTERPSNKEKKDSFKHSTHDKHIKQTDNSDSDSDRSSDASVSASRSAEITAKKSAKSERKSGGSDKSKRATSSGSDQGKRSFEAVVQERFKQDWSVEELKNNRPKKTRVDHEALFEENLKKFQENAETIASRLCGSLEERLDQVTRESRARLNSDLEEQTEHVQEIVASIESLKTTLHHEFDEKREELRNIVNRADTVIRKAQEMSSREQSKLGQAGGKVFFN